MAGNLSKKATEADRRGRMKWWREARFGMFVHWGLYSLVGRHEWVMNQEQWPREKYEALAGRFKPTPHAARQWARLAKAAGQKYMVLTTKHHDGYCLWDSNVTDYCAAKTGPGRDLVAEYVDACRQAGLRVGLYYSLMDWHHPDGLRCRDSTPARRRFLDYTQEQLRELMSRYGQIDILWYDVPYPLPDAKAWEARKMNAMVRKLQPGIIINNRCMLDEDFGTPEEHITAAGPGRAWESCMTFNGSWGYMDTPEEDYRSARTVIMMLQQVTAGGGNLLLNIGPAGDGSVPAPAHERLMKVGKWLKTYGEDVVYGQVDRADGLHAMCNFVEWTRRGNTAFAWLRNWPSESFGFGYFKGEIKSIRLLVPGGAKRLQFRQEKRRVWVAGLPQVCPDKSVGIAVLAVQCASRPQRTMASHFDSRPDWQ